MRGAPMSMTCSDVARQTNVPDLVSARMLDEFCYCPRLACLEWVQGEWAHNRETLEGRFRHRRVDRPSAGEAIPVGYKRHRVPDVDGGAWETERVQRCAQGRILPVSAPDRRRRTGMRNVFLICYDLPDAKRSRRTYKWMCGYGTPVQYSVFRCELSPVERRQLQESLQEIMNWEHDRVTVIDLGPVDALG